MMGIFIFFPSARFLASSMVPIAPVAVLFAALLLMAAPPMDPAAPIIEAMIVSRPITAPP
jgi:hypothetical protein